MWGWTWSHSPLDRPTSRPLLICILPHCRDPMGLSPQPWRWRWGAICDLLPLTLSPTGLPPLVPPRTDAGPPVLPPIFASRMQAASSGGRRKCKGKAPARRRLDVDKVR